MLIEWSEEAMDLLMGLWNQRSWTRSWRKWLNKVLLINQRSVAVSYYQFYNSGWSPIKNVWWASPPSYLYLVAFRTSQIVFNLAQCVILIEKNNTSGIHLFLWKMQRPRIMFTIGIHGWVLIDWYPWSILQSTLHQHLGWLLINTPLTSQWTVGWESTNLWLMYESVNTQPSINCWPSIDSRGCQLGTNRDADWGYQLRVSINTRLRPPLAQNHDLRPKD